MAALGGFVSLAEIGRLMPGGVDPRDAAWMWRRLLVALGAAHRAGRHPRRRPSRARADPSRRARPRAGRLVLLGAARNAAARGRRALPALVSARGAGPRPAGRDTDIWLGYALLTELMGGRLPAPLAAFARGCQLASPARRPQDAWQLLAELDELLGRLYGAAQFRPFVIPA